MSDKFFDRELSDSQFVECLRTYIPNYLKYVLDTYIGKTYNWILTCNDPLLVELIQLCHLNVVRLKNQDIHVVYYMLSLAIKSHYQTLQIYYTPA